VSGGRMGGMRGTAPDPAAAPAPAPKVVKAGAEITVSCTYKLEGPTNWKLFGPKVWPLAVKVSATVSASEPQAAGTTRGGLRVSAKTAWAPLKVVLPPAE
jgi:hypothetical protein